MTSRFSTERKAKLAQLLKADVAAIDAFEDRVVDTILSVKGRETSPDLRSHRKKLNKIAKLAEELARALDDEELQAIVLPRHLGGPSHKIWEDINRRNGRRAFVRILRDVPMLARMATGASHPSKRPFRFWMMWGEVFDTWQNCRGRLTFSKTGDLMAVLSHVHEAAGWEPPVAGTVDEAVTDWKAGTF